ncbi:MAG TPA: lytic transglycosylase domain-containing protein [Lysobacter sp.]|nr:lytic transglycosylase domain-containing protein [Lysobacter sp.]
MVLAVALVSPAAATAKTETPATPAVAAATTAAAPTPTHAADAAPSRSGLQIYQQFQQGLADPSCGAEVSERWSKHYAAAPKRLASQNEDTLLLFGYVLDAVREAHLPSEYALIPFVESGYRPEARSPAGPAGMWQMIERTARNHKVPIRKGYDGRLSPVDSTRAAVRYLKTLHGMFAGDWRLAAMAYNAGEYRILSALKSGGQVARNAKPETLPNVPATTHAYVRKLHALACVLGEAEDRQSWVKAMDRPAPRLQAVTIGDGINRLADWADRNGQDADRLGRLNPAFSGGRIASSDEAPVHLLAPPSTSISGVN